MGIKKNSFRQQGKDIRAKINVEQRISDEQHIKLNILKVLNELDCKNKSLDDELIIGSYSPIGTEIKPPRVFDGYQIALPVIRNKNQMAYYPWREDQPLIKGAFGIKDPETDHLAPVIPDIILMPLLLCDNKGNRLGYGAGYYDRYIASLKHKPLLIGICFDEQVYSITLPADKHDMMLNLIITPKQIITTTPLP
jgi:5-formyltetrahydrofolate cyclo-ligase